MSPAPLPTSPSQQQQLDPPTLSTTERLSNRYDFNASLRAVGSWKPPALPNHNDGPLIFPKYRNRSRSSASSASASSDGGRASTRDFLDHNQDPVSVTVIDATPPTKKSSGGDDCAQLFSRHDLKCPAFLQRTKPRPTQPPVKHIWAVFEYLKHREH